MDHGTDSLLAGDADDTSDHDRLRAAGVTAVLSLTHGSPASPARGDTVVDRPLVDGPRNDAEAFADAVDSLRSLLVRGERVLVHCSAGASRSVAVAAAALAVDGDVPADEALATVCAARGVAASHPALADRAREYAATRRDRSA
jgi:hypothetical protein